MSGITAVVGLSPGIVYVYINGYNEQGLAFESEKKEFSINSMDELKAFLIEHKPVRVSCSSSIDFPEDSEMTTEDAEIVTQAIREAINEYKGRPAEESHETTTVLQTDWKRPFLAMEVIAAINDNCKFVYVLDTPGETYALAFSSDELMQEELQELGDRH